MIGIIGAMAIEVEGLIAQMAHTEKRTISGRDFYSGQLCDRDVVVVQSGIGKVNAAMCAEALILAYHPALVVNTGVAGAIRPGFHVGDIAVARDLVQHDVDTTAVGDPIGLVSTVNRVEFPCASWAVAGLMKAIASLPDLQGREARIASGDQFVSDTARKRFIADTFQGDVCEMEGCPIAQVCWINGVDCAVLRAISDTTDGEHFVEYSQFCAMAAERSAQVLMAFLKNLEK